MDEKRRKELEAKLRALAALSAPGSGATEAESIAAADKFRELMEKYNIEELGEVADLDPTSYQRYDFYHRDPWRLNLMNATASLNFCKIVRSHASVPQRSGNGLKDIWRITIIGTEMNRLAAILLFEYIEDNVKRASRGAGHAESFKLGASGRINGRIWQMIRDRETPVETTSNLPVVVADHEKRNMAVMDELFGKMGRIKMKAQKIDGDDYARGRQFGEKLDLTPLTASQKAKQIQ